MVTLKKGWAGYQQWVEVEAPPVDGIDDGTRRPDGIGEVGGAGDD